MLAVVRDSVVVALIALPGYFVSVYMVGKQTPKQIQLQGFLIMGLLYAIIGVKFSWLSSNRLVLVLMYGLTFFFSNYGPNTTVSVLQILHHYNNFDFTLTNSRHFASDLYDAKHYLFSLMSFYVERSLCCKQKSECPSRLHYIFACCYTARG